MNIKSSKTPWHSWKSGKLAHGCKLCVQGKKLVLFITGMCSQHCFYCPISEQKYSHDRAFANEWEIQDKAVPEELYKEIEMTRAIGAGITGGDPLRKIDRCCKYIRALKKRFGKKFHIHLYTPLSLLDKKKLKLLHSAGLDEIRLHPNVLDPTLWSRINLVKEFDWDIGIEIPCLPTKEKETAVLIDFIADKVDFLNLNELELSDTSIPHYSLDRMKYTTKGKDSYAVKGSLATALRLMRYATKKKIPCHVCTAKLKDGVQVKKRLIARAKSVATISDKRTTYGTLIRACIYLPELAPGIAYHSKLKAYPKQKILAKLLKARKLILHLDPQAIIDKKKCRLLVQMDKIKKLSVQAKELGLLPAIVEEFPTEESFEVDVRFL